MSKRIPIDTHTRINIYRDFKDDNVSHYHLLTYMFSSSRLIDHLDICLFEQQYLSAWQQKRLKEH